jgi:predicted GIY-YIG superfamily endonuclease
VTIPFVAGTSEKIARALRKHDVVTRFNCVRKIAEVLPSVKDSIPPGLREGVHQVPCSCGKYYIGETCRSLNVRLREHQRAATKKQYKASAIAEHVWSEPGHKAIFEEGRVIAQEKRYFPRLIREAIEIRKTPNNFNREDGYPLHGAWKRIIDLPPKTGTPPR